MSISLDEREKDYLLTVGQHSFNISKPLAEYIKNSNSLNEETIECTTSKTGVVTLKIKSLTYKEDNTPKSKVLSLYKIPNNNSKERKEMKFKISFYRIAKKRKLKTLTKFESFVLSVVKPVLANEFNNTDELQSAVYDALKPFMTEESKWEITPNNKTGIGLVVKNTYKNKNYDSVSNNMFFINEVTTEDAENTSK